MESSGLTVGFIALAKAYRGWGYGSEAVRLLEEWGLREAGGAVSGGGSCWERAGVVFLAAIGRTGPRGLAREDAEVGWRYRKRWCGSLSDAAIGSVRRKR